MMKKSIVLIASILINSLVFSQEVAHAKVRVTDFDDNPISGAEIQFFDTDRDKTLKAVSKEDGTFEIDLEQGIYNIRLKSVGKTRDYQLIEIPELKGREQYGTVQIMIQYEEESTFTLSNLHFETNKSVIKQDSYEELDELVDYLKRKPELKIEIAGHTDNDGSEAANMVLSQDRADAVKRYLIGKGVSESRLTAKGYGEKKPIADNDSVTGRALNRRTEIHVLE